MSGIEEKDLEDEIPASKIIYKDTSCLENKTVYCESVSFVEYIVEEDLNENDVEYVDYNSDEGEDVYAEDSLEDMARNSKDATIASIKTEANDDVEAMAADDDELYNCISCGLHFHSVIDHINQYHKNQSVLIDGIDWKADNDDNVELEPIKNEIKIEAVEDMIETDVEEDQNGQDLYSVISIQDAEEDNDRYKIVSQEKCYDVHGRPYVRKKVHISNSGIINSTVHKCVTCNISFYSMVDFDNHKCEDYQSVDSASEVYIINQSNSNKKEGPHECKVCKNKFFTLRSLASHMRVHKSNDKETKTPKPVAFARPAICTLCNTTFPSNKSLKLHMRMHDPIKTKPIEDALGYELKSTKEERLAKEMFFCDLCDKSYDKIYEEIHKGVHVNAPKFFCTVCNKKFASQMNLTMHLKAHQDHVSIKGMTKAESNGITLPYECGYCGRQFARPHEKVKHERIHTGEKPYKCEICGKSFRVSYSLTLHLRTHTAARPYVCPHCTKRFKAYAVYNHHLMIHSDERPFKCPYCPKAFKTSVQLGGHKNSHTKPFNCPECNRPFASLYAAKAHFETHKKSSQNLKHRCGICGAIYARVFALRDHMREQHQTTATEEREVTDYIISEVEIGGGDPPAKVFLPNDNEKISLDDIEPCQTEEVITDWP